MSMTPKQAFKLAFLQHLVDRGYTMDEVRAATAEAVEKTAGLGDMASNTWNLGLDAVRSLGNTAKGVGLIGALTAPPLIGAGLGYGAAKLTDWDDVDAEESKKRELIELYRRHTQQAKLNRVAKLRREGRQPTFSRI